MYSIKHLLPNYVWRDWICDEDYEYLKKETGAICPVRDTMLNGQHVHNHDWNMPPRHSKSTIINICGPVWAAVNCPIQVATVSHTNRLSSEMNVKKQTLINSDKYKYYFRPDIGPMPRRSSAQMVELLNGSQLYSVCQDSFTGFGADIIICDDLVSTDNARKDGAVLRDSVEFFKNTVPTRRNNPLTAVIWQVQQRIGRGDVSGTILADPSLSKLYSHTEIQAISDKDINIIYPCTGKIKQIKKGDYLWPERFGDYSSLKMQMSPEDFDTQYQQDPTQSTANIIKESYIHYIDEKDFEDDFKDIADNHYVSHDCPVKDKKSNDFHGYCEGYGKTGELVICDGWEKHIAFVEEAELFKDLEVLDPSIIQVVEDKANGASLLQHLGQECASLVAFNPGSKSKAERLQQASFYMNNGSVRFVKNENTKYLIEQLLKFPFGVHDDIVDACSQLILYHFTQNQLGVYTGSFTYQNIIDDVVISENTPHFLSYAATIKGTIIKVIGVNINYKDDTYTVEREWVFNTVRAFEEWMAKEIIYGQIVLDCSNENTLSSIINNVGNIYTFDDNKPDQSRQLLKSGFYNKKVLVCKGCTGTKTDIARLRITDSSRLRGMDRIETYDEGFAGCLRAIITYTKGASTIWG